MNARFLGLLLSCVLVLSSAATARAEEPRKKTGGISLELLDKGSKKNSGGISLELLDSSKPADEREPNLSEQSADRYAALAYSSSTRRYGYAYAAKTADEAKAAALKWCRADDARIVAWVKNGYIAIAHGHNGAIGWGWSPERERAVQFAHDNCLRYSSTSNLTAVVSAKN
jgi:hypothetical protein